MSETVRYAPDGGWGWVIVFCSFSINGISMGIMSSLSVVFVAWLDEFGLSKGATSWIMSVGLGVMFGVGPLSSSLSARFGHQTVVFCGGLLSCMGFVISYFATSVPYLIVSVGILAGAGFGLAILPGISEVAVYFNKRQSVAMGIGTAGTGVGCFVLAALCHWLNEKYGWRGTVLIIAGIALHLCICGLLMRPLPSISVITTEDETADSQPDADQMPQNKYKLTNRKMSTLECVEEDKELEPSPIEISAPPTEPSTKDESRLTFENATDVYKNSKAQSTLLLDSDIFKARTGRRATVGDGIQIPHTSKPMDQRHLARQVSSAMELRSPTFGTDKLYLKTDTMGTTGAILRKSDILMCGSIHSLALIDGKLLGSRGYSLVPSPETLHTVSEVQPATSSRCPCSESIIRIFSAFSSSFALLKNGVFAIFVVCNFLTNLTYMMPVVYMVDRALANDLDKSAAAILLSLNGAGNLFGRLFFGFLADKSFVDRLLIYIGCLTVGGLATSLSPLCGTSAFLHGVYACTFGCFMGAYVTLTPLVAVDLLGVAHVSEAYGILLMFFGLACVAGSPLGGWIFDWTGSFTTSYILHGLFVLLGAAMLLPIVYLKRCRRSGSQAVHEAEELMIK